MLTDKIFRGPSHCWLLVEQSIVLVGAEVVLILETILPHLIIKSSSPAVSLQCHNS